MLTYSLKLSKKKFLSINKEKQIKGFVIVFFFYYSLEFEEQKSDSERISFVPLEHCKNFYPKHIWLNCPMY